MKLLKRVSETVDYYRRPEVVKTFEEDRYSTNRGQLRYELQNRLSQELMDQTNDPLLEVAAGSGRFTRQFASMGRSLVAFDASWNMIERNRLSIDESKSPIGYVQGLADALPFASGVFSTLFCVDMMSHIADPRPILTEMHRVLKKGGILVLNFTNRSSLMGLGATTITNPLRKLVGRLDVYSTCHWSGPLLKFIDQLGFARIRTTGLFFIDPRLLRFPFGERMKNIFIRFDRWFTAKNCRFLYEQIWVKAVKER